MDFKVIAGKIIASAVGKTAVISVASVTAGAVVATGVTTTTYKKEIKHYKAVAEAATNEENVESKSTLGEKADGTTSILSSLEGQTLRVFDGMVQIYTESGWTDYATVSEIEKQDPFYETEEKRAQVELEVLNEKLAEAGIAVNEEGEFVPISEISEGKETKEVETYKVGSIVVEKASKSEPKGANNVSQSSTAAPTVIDPAAIAALLNKAPKDPTAAAVLQQTVASATTYSSSSDNGGSGSGAKSFNAIINNGIRAASGLKVNVDGDADNK